LKTALTHLPEAKQYDINLAKELILQKANPHMIILFGSYSRGNWVEDSYVENGTTYSYISDYDILVVMEKESDIEGGLSKHVRKRMDRSIPMQATVHIIAHGIDYLNEQLEEGRYFFTDIIKEGTLLYDSGKHKLATARNLTPAEVQKKAQEYYDQWFTGGEDFLFAFGQAIHTKRYTNAAFQLHQATERFFMTILLVFTDYKPKIHDLEVLYREVCACDARFKPIFPLQPEEENRKFLVLRDAYIDSRYKPDYTVSPTDLEWLATRVQKLKELTEVICKEKIEGYGR